MRATLAAPPSTTPSPTSTGALYKTYEIYASNGQLISEYTPSIGANAASSHITKTLTEHVYIGNKRLAESKRTTLHPPGSPVSNQYVNTYFHLDPAGTPLLASTPQGTLLWHESTRPYGSKRLNQPASAGNSVGYAGKPFDNITGLSYMGARYYDPVLGRFMGIDPVGFQESNLHSHNRYTYANNNPYRFVDPDGRDPDGITGEKAATAQQAVAAAGKSFAAFKAEALENLANVAGVGGKGKAAPTVKAQALPQQPAAVPPNINLARHFDTGKPVGIDRSTGLQTSEITVITNAKNELVTAFPGKPL